MFLTRVKSAVSKRHISGSNLCFSKLFSPLKEACTGRPGVTLDVSFQKKKKKKCNLLKIMYFRIRSTYPTLHHISTLHRVYRHFRAFLMGECFKVVRAQHPWPRPISNFPACLLDYLFFVIFVLKIQKENPQKLKKKHLSI